MPLVAEEVYKTVDEEGRVSFSSSGAAGAEKVQVKDANSISLPKKTAEQKRLEAKRRVEAETIPYTALVFLNPEEKITYIKGVELPYRIDVRVNLTPSLQVKRQHRFQYYFDGEPVGKPSSHAFITLADIHRGSYSLSVTVIDTLNDNEELIRSEAVELNVDQHSRLLPVKPAPKAKASAGK